MNNWYFVCGYKNKHFAFPKWPGGVRILIKHYDWFINDSLYVRIIKI